MSKSQKISRRSALKSLFIVAAVPAVLVSSCTKIITSPETPQESNSKLSKSHLDSEIATLEHITVVNNNGIAEIPKKYLHVGKSGKSVNLVLTREGKNNFILNYKKIEITNNKSKNNFVNVKGLSDGAIIIAKPAWVVKSLGKTNYKELKRKFIASAKIKRGGIK